MADTATVAAAPVPKAAKTKTAQPVAATKTKAANGKAAGKTETRF